MMAKKTSRKKAKKTTKKKSTLKKGDFVTTDKFTNDEKQSLAAATAFFRFKANIGGAITSVPTQFIDISDQNRTFNFTLLTFEGNYRAMCLAIPAIWATAPDLNYGSQPTQRMKGWVIGTETKPDPKKKNELKWFDLEFVDWD